MFNFRQSTVENYTITNISQKINEKDKDILTSISISQPHELVKLLNQIENLNLSKSDLTSLIECLKYLK